MEGPHAQSPARQSVGHQCLCGWEVKRRVSWCRDRDTGSIQDMLRIDMHMHPRSHSGRALVLMACALP